MPPACGEADLDAAQVGIAACWYEGNPCNVHLWDLAAKVKEGVVAAGLVGMRFSNIGVSDGIAMGTDGMSYSLQSRELIADSASTSRTSRARPRAASRMSSSGAMPLLSFQ